MSRSRVVWGQSGGPVYRVIDQNLDKGDTADRMERVGMIYNLVDFLVLGRPAVMIQRKTAPSTEDGAPPSQGGGQWLALRR